MVSWSAAEISIATSWNLLHYLSNTLLELLAFEAKGMTVVVRLAANLLPTTAWDALLDVSFTTIPGYTLESITPTVVPWSTANAFVSTAC